MTYPFIKKKTKQCSCSWKHICNSILVHAVLPCYSSSPNSDHWDQLKSRLLSNMCILFASGTQKRRKKARLYCFNKVKKKKERIVQLWSPKLQNHFSGLHVQKHIKCLNSFCFVNGKAASQTVLWEAHLKRIAGSSQEASPRVQKRAPSVALLFSFVRH